MKILGKLGALMISMDIEHPDIVEFINSKNNVDNINSANISVEASDNFFTNLDNVKNKKVLSEIARNNWETGEPGMLFWNRIEDWHLLSEHPEYKLHGVNPCAEQPLPKYGNCLLGSINLSNFVINPFTKDAEVDYNRLSEVVRVATIGLNEVLDEGIPLHPLQEQRDMAWKFRQIGLGIMGLADMFIKLGIEYGSYESLLLSQKLGVIIRDNSIKQSIELAKEEGAYPAFNENYIKESDYFKSLSKDLQDDILNYGMRNSHVLSIAPTGSISNMLGISGGIEPHFNISYTRTTKSLSGNGDMEYKVYTEIIKELMEYLEIKNENELPEYVITSHNICPEDRIKLQSMWQDVIDSAISSTINLKEDTTPEEIEEIYKLAWGHGLKGVTVFRDNCKRIGILKSDSKDDLDDCIGGT